MSNDALRCRAAIVASYVPDKAAMIAEMREILDALRLRRRELDEDIAHGEAMIVALSRIDAE